MNCLLTYRQLFRSRSRLTSLPSLTSLSYRPLHCSATMSHSKACCQIPPIVAKGYQAKGKYETINGLKTCMPFINALGPCPEQC